MQVKPSKNPAYNWFGECAFKLNLAVAIIPLNKIKTNKMKRKSVKPT